MKLSFIGLGTTPIMFSTDYYPNPKIQATTFAHNLTLPSDVILTAKQNFIPRMLFVDKYRTVLASKW